MINFFLSSTFSDMQRERDAIQKYVLPQLSNYTIALGQLCAMTDLRWGINTDEMNEQDAMCKIMDVCLKKVEECNPYFIILLGDNYGSVPEDSLIDRFVSLYQSGANYSSQELYGRSVTDIEIQHYLKVLRQKGVDEKIIVCFRSSKQIGTQNDKLHQLKKQLRGLFPESILEYEISGIPEKESEELQIFTGQLQEKIETIIRKGYVKSSWEQLQYSLQKDYIEKYRNYIVSPELRNVICENTYVVLEGNDIDKRMAVASELSLEENVCTLLYFEITEGLKDRTQIINFLLWQIHRELPEFAYINDGMAESDLLHNGIQQLLAQGKKVHLILHLHDDKMLQDAIRYIIPVFDSQYEENYRCIISCNHCNYESIAGRMFQIVPCNYCPDEMLVRAELRKYKKEVSDIVCSAILDKAKNKSQKYLHLLIWRITMVDKEIFDLCAGGDWNKKWNHYITVLLEQIPNEESELEEYLITVVKREHPKFQMEKFIELASCFEKGLMDRDYAEILGLSIEEIWEVVYRLPMHFEVDSDKCISYRKYDKKDTGEREEIPVKLFTHMQGLEDSSYSKASLYLVLEYIQYNSFKAKECEQEAIECLSRYALYLARLCKIESVNAKEFFKAALKRFKTESAHFVDIHNYGWFWIELLEHAFKRLRTDDFINICMLLSLENINYINTSLRSPSFPRAIYEKILKAGQAREMLMQKEQPEKMLFDCMICVNRLRTSMNPGMHKELIKNLERKLKHLHREMKGNKHLRLRCVEEITDYLNYLAHLKMNDHDLENMQRVRESSKWRSMAMELLEIQDYPFEMAEKIRMYKTRIVLSFCGEMVDLFKFRILSAKMIQSAVQEFCISADQMIAICEDSNMSSEGKNALGACYWMLSIAESSTDRSKALEFAEKGRKEFSDLYLYQKQEKVMKNIEKLDAWIFNAFS